jgi:type IV secretory pathway VirB2 component (pilin)
MNKIKFLFFLTLLAAYVLPEMAHASTVGGGGFLGSGTNFLNAVETLLTTTWARVISVIAVAIVGIMAMTGKLSWATFMWVFGGMVLLFGAGAIADSVEDVAHSTMKCATMVM